MKIYISICFLVLMSSVTSAQSYQVHFTQMTGLDYDYDSNNLYKPSPDSWSNSMAMSSNVVKNTSSPMVSYKVDNSTSNKAFGWADTYVANAGLEELEHAFYLDNKSLYVIESGRIKGQFGKIQKDDVLTITYQGSRVYFRKNGRYLTRSVASSPVGIKIAAVIFNQGGEFLGMTSNVNHDYYLKDDITDISGGSSGVINFISLGDVPSPEEYFWGDDYVSETDFNNEFALLDSDLAGLFSVTPYDDIFKTGSSSVTSDNPQAGRMFYPVDGSITSTSYSLSHPLVVVSQNDVTSSPDRTLTATDDGAEIIHEAFWYTQESGWLSCTLGGYSEGIIFGLFDSEDNTQPLEIIYGWDIKSNGLYTLNNGASNLVTHNPQTNDVLQIILKNGEVIYEINGDEVARYNLSTTVELYQMRTELKNKNSYLKKVHHSAKPYVLKGCSPTIFVDHLECDGSGLGSIYIDFKGVDLSNCNSPFDFQFGSSSQSYLTRTGLTSTTYDNLTAGVYTLNIINSLGQTVWNGTIDVGYKHDWIEVQQAFSEDFPTIGYNEIQYQLVPGVLSPNGLGDGYPRLPIQTGWIEYDVELLNGAINAAFFKWSNTAESDGASIGSAISSNNDLTTTTGLVGLSSVITDSGLNDLKSYKIVRDGDNYKFYINSSTQSVLVFDGNASGISGLVGYLKLRGVKIINTYSSYKCQEYPVYFSEMKRSVGAELHVMSITEIQAIYNEPYNASTIQSLSLVTPTGTEDVTSEVGNISRGDNRMTIPISSQFGLSTGDIVVLELKNNKNEIYYLKCLLLAD